MSNELYVLVLERETYRPEDGGRPVVMEQYIDEGAASLEAVKTRAFYIGDKYGKARIAKLQFIEEEE